MRRLIDKDDTLKIIADTISLHGTGTKVESEILSVVSNIPSAEPKKGRWIPVEAETDDDIIFDIHKCSECMVHYSPLHMNYCPNCGAKMKEESR